MDSQYQTNEQGNRTSCRNFINKTPDDRAPALQPFCFPSADVLLPCGTRQSSLVPFRTVAGDENN
jgi:hypothetical protein